MIKIKKQIQELARITRLRGSFEEKLIAIEVMTELDALIDDAERHRQLTGRNKALFMPPAQENNK